MKSNLQLIKLFLLLALSCTSLLISQTYTVGRGLGDRPNSKMIVAQTPRFEQPPVPAGGTPGGRVRGGASRGEGCTAATPDLTALVPFTEKDGVTNVWAQTTLERPSWFFYVPYTKDVVKAVQFVVRENSDSKDSKEIYDGKSIVIRDKPGVIRISLPSNAPALALNKEYRWFFSINCDQEQNAPWTYVEGVIQRVNLNQSIAKELETAEPLKRYAIYAQNGIWYEALATLAQLREKNPKDSTLQAQWQNLLTNINLADVAKEPLVLDNP
ncbi:DUF928 domain-containing protein [Nostoc sp. PA-18-2419]|uniref:DUF928 domain-containing protein n=1 Tax=Nostoc sp. PA-18-2419 TaxID=2575443 RepID=UPI001107C336|nr:DUF928 domain-containing protein [Nostoc sp. PA-18-2419]